MRTLDDTRLSERDRTAIKEAAALLMAQFPVTKVVLFGSKARGDDDPDSDIDLLVLTERHLDWEERAQIVKILFHVGLTHDVLFSFLDAPQEEWSAGIMTVLPIHSEIDRDGVLAA
jgi:predicted nucleotidyltransferase